MVACNKVGGTMKAPLVSLFSISIASLIALEIHAADTNTTSKVTQGATPAATAKTGLPSPATASDASKINPSRKGGMAPKNDESKPRKVMKKEGENDGSSDSSPRGIEADPRGISDEPSFHPVEGAKPNSHKKPTRKHGTEADPRGISSEPEF